MTSPYTDPYRFDAADTLPGTASPVTASPAVARTLLWTVLVISVAANTVASYAAADLWVHLACGGVTALSAGTLVARKLRARR